MTTPEPKISESKIPESNPPNLEPQVATAIIKATITTFTKWRPIQKMSLP